ncbi:hypothetical protein [Caballeronia zhejiangensis]|uniref:hypothetical protein n=1 Tax=Caballeronia zhejiangensis TaxID=871203 RepID=UPI001186DA7B|nr:hypothetical protein [Caballeronia zhejiangensis]
MKIDRSSRPPVRPLLASTLSGVLAALCAALVVALLLRANSLSGAAWFTAPIALAAGVSVGLFVRRGIRSVRMSELVAIVVAAGFAAAIAGPAAQHYPQVSVTALGEKNPASKSTEVWVGMKASSTPSGHWSGNNWESRGDRYVSYGKQPATLVWNGGWGSGAALLFARHGWSGLARVTIDGHAQTVDLYSPTNDALTIALPQPSVSWGDTALWALYLAGVMLAASFVAHLLKPLPPASSATLAIAFVAACLTLFALRDRSYAGSFEVVAFQSNGPLNALELDTGHGFTPDLRSTLPPSAPTTTEIAAPAHAAMRMEATNGGLNAIEILNASGTRPTAPAELIGGDAPSIEAGRTFVYELSGTWDVALSVVDSASHRHPVAIPQTGSDRTFVLVERDASRLTISVSRSFLSLPPGMEFSGRVEHARMLDAAGHPGARLYRLSFDQPRAAFALPSESGGSYRVSAIARPDTHMFKAVKFLAAVAVFCFVLMLPVALRIGKSLAGLARNGRMASVTIGVFGIVGWMGFASLLGWPAVVGWDAPMPYLALDSGSYGTWYGVSYPLIVGALLLLQGPKLITALSAIATTLLLLAALAHGLRTGNKPARALLALLCVAGLPLTTIPFASVVHLRDAMNGLVMAIFAVALFSFVQSWGRLPNGQRTLNVCGLIALGALATSLRVDNLPSLLVWFAGACLLLNGRRLPRLGMLAAAVAVWLSVTPGIEHALFPDHESLASEKRLYGTTALVNPVTGMLKLGKDTLPGDDAARARIVLDRIMDVDDGLKRWTPYNIIYWHLTEQQRPIPTPGTMRDLQHVFARLAIDRPMLFFKIRLATFASNVGYTGKIGNMQWDAQSFETQSFLDRLVETTPGRNFRSLYGLVKGHRWIDAFKAFRHWTASVATHVPQLLICLVAIACFRRYPLCAMIAAGCLARACVFFLFAPASIFLYLYDLHLIGFCLPFLMAGSPARPAMPAGRTSGDA